MTLDYVRFRVMRIPACIWRCRLRAIGCELERLVRVGTRRGRCVWRSGSCFCRRKGCGTMEIMPAHRPDIKADGVALAVCVMEAGVDGLLRDKSRPPGTPPSRAMTPSRDASVLTKTMRETPPDATHWSSALDGARDVGISHTSVQNIWRAHGLQAASGGQLQGLQRSRRSRRKSRTWSASISIRRTRPWSRFGRREEPDPGTRPSANLACP